MSPRLAKKNQPDLPRQQIQPGGVGCCPFFAQSAAWLRDQRCDALICLKDDAAAQALKAASDAIPLSGELPLSLEGRWFNGFSDAFFRGKLPQVMLIADDAPHQSDFFEELADYFDKLLSLGYFLNRADPVEALIPCFAFIGDGCWFRDFEDRLARMLRNLHELDASLRAPIQGKFARGLLAPALTEGPPRLWLAGGAATARITLQSTLSAKGFAVTLPARPPETRGAGAPVDLLEAASVLRSLRAQTIPVLTARQPQRSASRWRQRMQERLSALALHVGCHELLDAIATHEPSETPSTLQAQSALESFARWTGTCDADDAPDLLTELRRAFATSVEPSGGS